MANKSERISYAINKECCRNDLTDWCEEWDFTVEDFEAFLRAGEKHFEEEINDGK